MTENNQKCWRIEFEDLGNIVFTILCETQKEYEKEINQRAAAIVNEKLKRISDIGRFNNDIITEVSFKDKKTIEEEAMMEATRDTPNTIKATCDQNELTYYLLPKNVSPEQYADMKANNLRKMLGIYVSLRKIGNVVNGEKQIEIHCSGAGQPYEIIFQKAITFFLERFFNVTRGKRGIRYQIVRLFTTDEIVRQHKREINTTLK